MMFLNKDEILYICSYLNDSDLGCLSLSCRCFNDIIQPILDNRKEIHKKEYKHILYTLDKTYNHVTNLCNINSRSLVSLRFLDLRKFENLKTLYIWNNPLTDLRGLRYCTTLKYLDCDYTRIRNFKGLENCKDLREITSMHGCLSSLEGIQGLKQLHSLKVSGNKLTSLRYIALSVTTCIYDNNQIDYTSSSVTMLIRNTTDITNNMLLMYPQDYK